MNLDERTYYIERRKQKEQRKSEQVRERRDKEHNEQRQRQRYEAKKCSHCHKPIAEKLMTIATEACLFTGYNAEFNCSCPRPSLIEQTRRFLFTYRYGNNPPVTVIGVQFPNRIIALSVRFNDGSEKSTHIFESMGTFKAYLSKQNLIHDWIIAWGDPEPQRGIEP